MPNPALKIAALMVEELPAPDDPKWADKMRAIITRGHTAAWLTATGERLGVPVDSPLLSRARLSRAERNEIKGIVEKQLTYLREFEKARGEMSEQAVQARSDMYPGAVSQTWASARWGDWVIPEHLLPGTAQCLTRCLCEISVEDNGDGTGTLTRTLNGEAHCDDCPPLAGTHEVQRREA